MTYEEFQDKLLANIRDAKKERGITIRELSKRTGMSTVTISLVLAGKRNITLYTLWALAGGLEMEVEDLLDGKSICGKHRKALQGHAVGHRKDKA